MKEVMELIKFAGLMKTVSALPQCFEGLVEEFVVNTPEDIFDKNIKEFCKVFVRGKCRCKKGSYRTKLGACRSKCLNHQQNFTMHYHNCLFDITCELRSFIQSYTLPSFNQ